MAGIVPGAQTEKCQCSFCGLILQEMWFSRSVPSIGAANSDLQISPSTDAETKLHGAHSFLSTEETLLLSSLLQQLLISSSRVLKVFVIFKRPSPLSFTLLQKGAKVYKKLSKAAIQEIGRASCRERV